MDTKILEELEAAYSEELNLVAGGLGAGGQSQNAAVRTGIIAAFGAASAQRIRRQLHAL